MPAEVIAAPATPAPASVAATVSGTGWPSLCQVPSASGPETATAGAVSSVSFAVRPVISTLLLHLSAKLCSSSVFRKTPTTWLPAGIDHVVVPSSVEACSCGEDGNVSVRRRAFM